MVGELCSPRRISTMPCDDIVVLVLAGDAEPRLLADGDGGDVLDQHRRSVGRGDHGVGERVDRADQADAAHDRRLLRRY